MPERFPRDFLLSLFLAVLVAACGTSAGAVPAADAGGSSISDGAGGADRSAGDAGGVDGTSAEAKALDAAADGDSSCPSDPPPPPTEPSVGTVTFVVTNASTADRYVVTQGQLCDPFTIAGEQTSVPFSCMCECAVPQPSFTLTSVSAGQTITLTWDGRHLVPYTTHFDCGAYGYPGVCSPIARGSPQPVPPGPLSVSIAYATQVTPDSASRCGATTGGFMCTSTSDPQCGMGGGDPSIQFVTQSFTLPASGGVTVQVSIP
jgi:hypothetical protein